ncbi:MAG: hypothetical protein LQ351_008111 [Letrouitia transgressa]|nr:MAG: hypothetical protein LQ351_008111 [Letrouitia transgressa]
MLVPLSFRFAAVLAFQNFAHGLTHALPAATATATAATNTSNLDVPALSCGSSSRYNLTAIDTDTIATPPFHNGRLICVDQPRWKTSWFEPSDCVVALRSLQFETLRRGSSTSYVFEALGAEPKLAEAVATPVKARHATCVLAVVMLASLHQGQLPDMPVPPWQPRQEITFGELETEAARLMRGCVVPVSGTRGQTRTGWVAVDIDNKLGLLNKSTKQTKKACLDQNPRRAHGALRATGRSYML